MQGAAFDDEKPALPGIPPSQWWGYKVPSVNKVVDIATTYGEMDNLARGFYTNGLSCGKLRNRISLAVKKGSIQRGQVIGIEGIQGPKGKRGIQGPRGLGGDKGDKGPSYTPTQNELNAISSNQRQDNMGPKGPNGFQGLVGKIGPQGQVGIDS